MYARDISFWPPNFRRREVEQPRKLLTTRWLNRSVAGFIDPQGEMHQVAAKRVLTKNFVSQSVLYKCEFSDV